MFQSAKELFDALDQPQILTEVTNELLNLDELPSTATQADLNNMLVHLHNRLAQGDDIIIEEISGKPVTTQEFDAWVEKNFGEYSANLYKESISK